MFIGHYAVAFVLRKKNKNIPLWLLFLMVQLPSIVWSALVVFGIERAQYEAMNSAFTRMVNEFFPYSHSLFSVFIISAVVFAIFALWKGKEWGTMLSIAVFSHWVLDAIVEISNMPLFINNGAKVGLGFWNYPLVSFCLEVAMLFLSVIYTLHGTKSMRLSKLALGTSSIMIIVFSIVFFTYSAPHTPIQYSLFFLGLTFLFPFMAYLLSVEKRVIMEHRF